MKKVMLTIVIPAFNEESHIAKCLESIKLQSEKPDQVIVVNNNSTDRTVEIAKTYDFVQIINETNQGVIPSVVAGLNAASGDLVGRINADVVLDNDWVSHAKSRFAANPDISALTGLVKVRIMLGTDIVYSVFWSWLYLLGAEAYFGTNIIWDANMVIRKSAWLKITKQYSRSDSSMVHADQDMSLYLDRYGLKILRDNKLLCQTSEQSYHYLPKLVAYLTRAIRTKHMHISSGTYDSDLLPRIAIWRRVLRYVFLAPPIIVFFATSVIIYPFATLYLKYKHKRP